HDAEYVLGPAIEQILLIPIEVDSIFLPGPSGHQSQSLQFQLPLPYKRTKAKFPSPARLKPHCLPHGSLKQWYNNVLCRIDSTSIVPTRSNCYNSPWTLTNPCGADRPKTTVRLSRRYQPRT